MFCLLVSFPVQTLFPGWLEYKQKLGYSNLWLVALHPCFQPASLNSPSPLPYKSWRCEQDPVLRPVLAASTAKPSNMKERSMQALVQQYPRRFLKNGILRRGQADQRRGSAQLISA